MHIPGSCCPGAHRGGALGFGSLTRCPCKPEKCTEGSQENASQRLPREGAAPVAYVVSTGYGAHGVTHRVPTPCDSCISTLGRALAIHQVISWGGFPVSLEETGSSVLPP